MQIENQGGRRAVRRSDINKCVNLQGARLSLQPRNLILPLEETAPPNGFFERGRVSTVHTGEKSPHEAEERRAHSDRQLLTVDAYIRGARPAPVARPGSGGADGEGHPTNPHPYLHAQPVPMWHRLGRV